VIFHVTTSRDWDKAKVAGDYRVSTRDKRLDDVGFIHASFEDQYARIGALIFRDSSEPLVVLVIDPDRVHAPIVVEDTTGGGEEFPHIYGPLPIDAVVQALPAAITDAGGLVLEPR
jgi:uncharacterized protein (DUF952 family)